ncbi:hypothetical protein [Bacteroides sp.]|uniref:hypothetical protein n=1 Tax=Bacteroides sp. TaxID=29523 RepID=UPI003D0C0467
MIFNLNNPYEIPKFKEYVNKLYEQKAIVEVKKKLPNRSTQQNRYFYLILSWFACETGYSVDEIKVDIFKRICNKEIFERYRENKHGEKIKYLRSSSDLDTLEMTTAIDRFRNYASAQAGIYLPSPNESQFLTYIEQEIERNKEFI